MKTKFVILAAGLGLTLTACKDEPAQSQVPRTAAATNSSSFAIDLQGFSNQINVAQHNLTNAVGEIKEAAGAAITEADRNLTERIRTSILSDPALSTNVENIKITTKDGKVILRGTVGSEAEKQSIEMKVRSMVGTEKLDSQLLVRPAKIDSQK